MSRGASAAMLCGMGDWSNIITAGVGPVIVISACGLLCLAFYNRLAAVVTRLRGFHRERLHEHEARWRRSDTMRRRLRGGASCWRCSRSRRGG